jgi:hypothetical protein
MNNMIHFCVSFFTSGRFLALEWVWKIMKKLTIMCYDISTSFYSKNNLPSIKKRGIILNPIQYSKYITSNKNLSLKRNLIVEQSDVRRHGHFRSSLIIPAANFITEKNESHNTTQSQFYSDIQFKFIFKLYIPLCSSSIGCIYIYHRQINNVY